MIEAVWVVATVAVAEPGVRPEPSMPSSATSAPANLLRNSTVRVIGEVEPEPLTETLPRP